MQSRGDATILLMWWAEREGGRRVKDRKIWRECVSFLCVAFSGCWRCLLLVMLMPHWPCALCSLMYVPFCARRPVCVLAPTCVPAMLHVLNPYQVFCKYARSASCVLSASSLKTRFRCVGVIRLIRARSECPCCVFASCSSCRLGRESGMME